MKPALTAHLETALQVARAWLPAGETTAELARRRGALLPLTVVAARLWGSLQPGRAAGSAAMLGDPATRAAARAAAMEFAPWPKVTAAAVLYRAEGDLLLAARVGLEPELAEKLRNDLAAAWARHDPDALATLHARLWTEAADQPAGLWAAEVRRQAAERELLPPESLLAAFRSAVAVPLTPAQAMAHELHAAIALWPPTDPRR